MSKQLIDLIDRLFDKIVSQAEKGQYKKALETIEKAEKLSEKANRPELLCQTLMFKGKALLALNRQEEALVEFQGMMELAIPLFLDDPEDTDSQYFVYNSIGFTVKTLEEIEDISKTQEFLSRNEKYFGKTFDAFEKLIAKEPDNFEYIVNYLKTLENVRGYYMRAQQFEKQVPVMGRIVKYYGKIFEIRSKKEELFNKLDKLIGEFKTYCFVFWKPEEAKEIFSQAEEVYRKVLEKEPMNRLAFRGLISLYEEFGDLYSRVGDIEKTEETYLKAFEALDEKIRKQPGDISTLRKQSEILQTLSRFFSQKNETEKAGQYAEKALEILKELPGKKPEDLDYQSDISDDFTELGELFGEIGDIEHAKECRMQEIDIYRNIHEKDPENLVSVANIAATFDQIGHLHANRGEIKPAKQYYERGIETYEKLLESDPENLEYEIGIANSLNYIGELYASLEPETASHYFEKALAINEKAVKLYPESTDYMKELIYTLKNIVTLNIEQKQYESAIQAHERITELHLEMIRKNPGDSAYEKDLGNARSGFGLLLERAEKPELAKQQYSKAAEAFRQILQNEEEESLAKDLLAMNLRMQITLLTHAKKHNLAKEYLDLVRDYYEKLYENDPENPKNWKDFSDIRLLEGILQESMKNYGIAIERYESIFPILTKHLGPDTEKLEYQAKVNIVYLQLGIVYFSANELEKSKEAFEKALSINAKLIEKDPESPVYVRDAIVTFEEYAKLLKKLDRNEEAEEYIAKAEKLNTNLE